MTITTLLASTGEALRAFIGFVSSGRAADVSLIVDPASPGV